MALTTKLPEFHRSLIEHPDDFKWWIEKEWSCPLHDSNANEYYDESGEEADITCLSCLAAGWKVKYDEDGWATLVFAEKDAFMRVLEAYYLPQITESLRAATFLGTMRPEEVKVEWQ